MNADPVIHSPALQVQKAKDQIKVFFKDWIRIRIMAPPSIWTHL